MEFTQKNKSTFASRFTSVFCVQRIQKICCVPVQQPRLTPKHFNPGYNLGQPGMYPVTDYPIGKVGIAQGPPASEAPRNLRAHNQLNKIFGFLPKSNKPLKYFLWKSVHLTQCFQIVMFQILLANEHLLQESGPLRYQCLGASSVVNLPLNVPWYNLPQSRLYPHV